VYQLILMQMIVFQISVNIKHILYKQDNWYE